jgi:sugar lactone lactonase YvrE
MTDVIECALDIACTIGESPLWSASEQALYFMDIKAPALFRFEPDSGALKTWPLTSDIGGFALVDDPPGALVALRFGLHRLNFATGAVEKLAASPFDPELFRFNEGACDAEGRFWIGVMFDPLDPGARAEGEERKKAALHSFTFEEGLRREPDVSDLHNGMAWSVDGRAFYLAHSYAQAIYVHSFANGRMGAGRPFARLPKSLGIPDGAAMDIEGGYWSACHGGGRLRRYNPDGTVDRDVILPVSQPTMCAFGGEALDDLYVTSARDRLSPAQLKVESSAGSLLKLRVGVRGVHRNTIAS